VSSKIFRHLRRTSQSMAYTNLHHGEVARTHFNLLRQRGVRRADVGAKPRHGRPQMIDERLDSRLCPGRIGPDERVNRSELARRRSELSSQVIELTDNMI
jgi:hypothetical protein